MYYRLDLRLRSAEGALVRVLSIAERRGFHVCSIQGSIDVKTSGFWQLQLIGRCSRHVLTLCRQLEKNFDCQSAAIVPFENVILNSDEIVAI